MILWVRQPFFYSSDGVLAIIRKVGRIKKKKNRNDFNVRLSHGLPWSNLLYGIYIVLHGHISQAVVLREE